MAKSSGLTTTVSVDDSGGTLRDISTSVFSVGISTPRGVQDITGMDKSAIERLLLLADAQISLTGVFDPTATTGSHTVLRTVSSNSSQRTVTVLINSTPTATLSCECIFADYQLNRGQDGSATWSATAQLANGTVPTWS
jgi:hypothetical protein